MRGIRGALCAMAVFFAAAALAQAQVPSKINYQGRLLRSGSPFNGTTNFVVRLYTAPTGGSAIYTENKTGVVVSDGLYSFYIGDSASGLAAALTNAAVYLELTVGAQTLAPREQVAAVAYALMAGSVPGGAIGTAQLADGAVTSAKIGASAVGGAQVADGAISDAEIGLMANIQPSKIQNTALTQSTVFGGDLSGTYGGLALTPGAVASGEIQDGSIRNEDIGDAAAIAPAKIQGTALTMATAFSGDVAGSYTSLLIRAAAVGAAEVADGSILPRHVSAPEFDLAYLRTSTWQQSDSTTNYVRRTGDTMTGKLDMGGNVISNAVLYGSGAGLTGLVGSVSLPLSNVVWVAVNGTPAGPGTLDRPFDMPQTAYDAAAPGGAVVIASGVYWAGLTMTKPDVHVIGLGRPILSGALTYSASAAADRARVLVQNVVFKMGASISSGSDLKLVNCRVDGTTTLSNSRNIEIQNCCLSGGFGKGLYLQNANDVISVNNSAIHSAFESGITVEAGTTRFEVIGCEVVTQSTLYGAVTDQELSSAPPQHLYTHNHFQAPKSGGIGMYAMGNGTVTFFHNTVQGDVSPEVAQYFANNTVIGNILWTQADAAMSKDEWGNIRLGMPELPTPWED